MRLLPLALLLGLLAPASAQDDPRRPPLYLVSHEGAKVYVLGSVHVLPVDALPLPSHVEDVYAAASVVAFEIDLAEAEERAFELIGAATDEALIGDLLDDEQRHALHTSVRSFGLPGPTFDEVEPWFGGMSFGMLTLRGSAEAYGQGVDAYLYERAWLDGKEVIALETLTDQISAFDDLSDESQVAYLMGLVANAEGAEAAFSLLLDAWASGDEGRLSGVLSDELAHPEVYESLLVRRNRSWMPALDSLLGRPGTVSLVVVGAGHLVGRGSLVELLREAGHKPQRL
ncbi:TraB/GumN family protein [Rubrivirga marina]|uniref:TraB/GumN family protein n=1 Tax=Rubrivirga marina TaxID=1196024 RepID=A0A271J0L5_9BACT|nr:TraB/GumN family protein [Rubrivirga marina]PAP77042.1 hypothetical protein BSZ37_11675 [Rubrivirga marina]